MKITTKELVEILDDIKKRVEVGDSFEGRIEYTCMQDDLKNGEWRIEGCYRIGNTEGQGGMRLLDA